MDNQSSKKETFKKIIQVILDWRHDKKVPKILKGNSLNICHLILTFRTHSYKRNSPTFLDGTVRYFNFD